MEDLVGKRFGLLVVEEFSHKNIRREPIWLCKCDCGNYKEVRRGNLISGNTKSCGCNQKRKPIIGTLLHKCSLCGKPTNVKVRQRLSYCVTCGKFLSRFYIFRKTYGFSSNLDMKAVALPIIEGNVNCHICGDKVTLEDASIDHVIPLSREGSSNLENLKITHWKCNKTKNNMTQEELISWCRKVVNYHDKT